MKKTTFFPFFIGIIITISLQAQNPYKDSLCAYTWNSSINNCPDPIVCISPEEWDGEIITIPANISRISPDSLKLCMGDLHLTTPVDIIYIMDLSKSMITTYNPSGDPYKKRDDALRAGFQYQIDSLKESHAGYVGFGSTIPADHLLAPVNVITGQTQLINMADLLETYVENDDHASGTQYSIALDQAITWLDDTTCCPHDIKAIIFISDGEPNNGYSYTTAQLQYLQDNSIAVHGIFLGNNMGVDLKNLATETGGTSTLVPPANSDTLATVVENIVKTYTDEIVAEEVTLINVTTADTATSVAEYEVSDTVWSVKMDNYIPLKPGLNEIAVNSTFQSVGGYDTTLEFTFYLDVQDTADYTSECYTCWKRTNFNVTYRPSKSTPALFDDTLKSYTDGYIIELSYYDIDTLDEAVIVVSTETNGDCDSIILSDLLWNGNECLFSDTGTLRFTYNAPVINNGITELYYDDIITFTWRHPRDLIDTIVKTTLVTVPYGKIDSLRIVTLISGTYQDISQLSMETSEDTTLYALGRRSDNNEWIPVSVPWNMTPLVTENDPPQSSNQWTVKPNGTSAAGIITIGYYFKDTLFYEIGTMSITTFLPLKQQKIRLLPGKSSQGASIQILLSNYIKSIDATLISANGRTIASCNAVNTKHISFDIGSVSYGIYFLQLKSNRQSVIKKVLFRY